MLKWMISKNAPGYGDSIEVEAGPNLTRLLEAARKRLTRREE
jgi:hypothetical protein